AGNAGWAVELPPALGEWSATLPRPASEPGVPARRRGAGRDAADPVGPGAEPIPFRSRRPPRVAEPGRRGCRPTAPLDRRAPGGCRRGRGAAPGHVPGEQPLPAHGGLAARALLR